MPAPTAPVAIVNLALDRIAQENISSITPPTSAVEAKCARHYDIVRRDVLRSYVWKFAKTFATLTEAAGVDLPPGYSAGFYLPADCLRLLRVGGAEDEFRYPSDAYTIQGNLLFISGIFSDDTLSVEYIKDQENVALFDPCFVSVLYLRLAKALSFAIQGAAVMGTAQLDADILKAEANAAAINGQETPPRRIERSRFADARRYSTQRQTGTPYLNME
jgi:hypothetical protein